MRRARAMEDGDGDSADDQMQIDPPGANEAIDELISGEGGGSGAAEEGNALENGSQQAMSIDTMTNVLPTMTNVFSSNIDPLTNISVSNFDVSNETDIFVVLYYV